MVGIAEWHDPLVADLPPKGAWLSKAQMVGVTQPAPANEAGLCGDEAQVVPVADTPRLG